MLVPQTDARPILRVLRDRALAALAAEAVGVGSAALDMAVAHARERHQFGKPIGAFQAVAHQLAQSFLELEAARSLAYWAAWAVSEGAPEAAAAAAAGKARAAEAAVASCERAIQIHGGIGFTWEHPLHRWYKRALSISAYLGWGPEHRARVAAHLLD
jgi:alkylation response protein AidB-like acyl-CoA dehydrogenase